MVIPQARRKHPPRFCSGARSFFSTDVPAKAGTHNHSQESLRQAMAADLRTTRACGYGSRIALGFASLVRDDNEFDFRLDFSNSQTLAFPRRDCVRVMRHSRPSENRGRRECRALSKHPQPRLRMKKANERSHHRYAEITPAFPARWLNGCSALSPVSRAC